jgi:hypothetical protein
MKEEIKQLQERIDKWKEHKLVISPMSITYCKTCGLSGSELDYNKCKKTITK